MNLDSHNVYFSCYIGHNSSKVEITYWTKLNSNNVLDVSLFNLFITSVKAFNENVIIMSIIKLPHFNKSENTIYFLVIIPKQNIV